MPDLSIHLIPSDKYPLSEAEEDPRLYPWSISKYYGDQKIAGDYLKACLAGWKNRSQRVTNLETFPPSRRRLKKDYRGSGVRCLDNQMPDYYHLSKGMGLILLHMHTKVHLQKLLCMTSTDSNATTF